MKALLVSSLGEGFLDSIVSMHPILYMDYESKDARFTSRVYPAKGRVHARLGKPPSD